MKVICRIKKILKIMPAIEGAGVHLNRAFGFYHVPQLDPFLLLDVFRSDNRIIIFRDFTGILIAESKQSPVC
jgi:redox-sensitive bicupin YhaK (pirin superfamily)